MGHCGATLARYKIVSGRLCSTTIVRTFGISASNKSVEEAEEITRRSLYIALLMWGRTKRTMRGRLPRWRGPLTEDQSKKICSQGRAALLLQQYHCTLHIPPPLGEWRTAVPAIFVQPVRVVGAYKAWYEGNAATLESRLLVKDQIQKICRRRSAECAPPPLSL